MYTTALYCSCDPHNGYVLLRYTMSLRLCTVERTRYKRMDSYEYDHGHCPCAKKKLGVCEFRPCATCNLSAVHGSCRHTCADEESCSHLCRRGVMFTLVPTRTCSSGSSSCRRGQPVVRNTNRHALAVGHHRDREM